MTRMLARYRRGLLSRATVPVDLQGSAVVVAPHPDDETLGCGGTIAKKIAAGAAVRVVVLSDGGKSHRHMPASHLAAIRRQEFREATGALGVEQHAATLLGLPDGELQTHIPAAASQIAALLQEHAPRQIFIPYRHEPPADHRAAHAAALQAVRERGESLTVYEYPVWFWARWPFVPFLTANHRSPLRQAGRTLLANLRMYSDFNCSQDVTMTLGDKRTALACYRTQTRSMEDQPGRQTLGEVHGGAWLGCMMRSREFFHRYDYLGHSGSG